ERNAKCRSATLAPSCIMGSSAIWAVKQKRELMYDKRSDTSHYSRYAAVPKPPSGASHSCPLCEMLPRKKVCSTSHNTRHLATPETNFFIILLVAEIF
ncbi:MAG TPA: hypothetical protein VF817_01765, partial [Patescibacteria group bacterium]